MQERRFIINTITHWNEPPRARHQVAFALAKKFPVLFVTASKIGFPMCEVNSSDENLKVLTPYFPINYKIRYRIPILNRIFQIWLFNYLRRKYREYTVINFDFTAKHLHRYFSRNVYYCNDDHLGMSYRKNPLWIARYQDSCEQSVARQAIFCIGTSAFLVNKLQKYNSSTFEIRLGAPDIKQLPVDHSNSLLDPALIHVGIVGYVQTIDPGLLNFLLSKKDLFLTLVGPISKNDQQRFMELSNIKTTGSLTGDELYKEVNRFDVGLIPYKMHSTIDRTPNKLWLYLALGKPTVISNIQGISDWEFPDHFVYRSNSQEEFYELIKVAHAKNSKALMHLRTKYAKENTWDIRMEKFLGIMDRLIPISDDRKKDAPH